jgi:hypothetical protein
MKNGGSIMKKFLVTLLAVTLLISLMGVANVFALDFGINSTIPDFLPAGSGLPQAGEDNETEPGTVKTQQWDLEGGFFDGSEITMVGGFDFKNGATYHDKHYASGDIFIDLDDSNQGTYGFEYALRLLFDVTNNTFDVKLFTLDEDSTYSPTTDILATSPWKVATAAKDETFSDVGTYWAGLNNLEAGFDGWTGAGKDVHYAVQMDLDDIFSSWSAIRGTDRPIFQFTMECGNDQLRFQDPVPEPTTVLLLGAGLIGLIGFGRKHLKK